MTLSQLKVVALELLAACVFVTGAVLGLQALEAGPVAQEVAGPLGLDFFMGLPPEHEARVAPTMLADTTPPARACSEGSGRGSALWQRRRGSSARTEPKTCEFLESTWPCCRLSAHLSCIVFEFPVVCQRTAVVWTGAR